MPQKNKDDNEQNIFILRSLYPEAEAIFSFKPQTLEQIKDNCLVVLDTNVLLLPFDTGQQSLEQIRGTYESLTKEGRLFIPGRVAREFAKNRSEKLKTIYQQISRKSNISINKQSYPLLESSPEYKILAEIEKEIDTKLSTYRKKVKELLEKIKGWYWDDPVSSLYRELFNNNVVFDINYDEQQLKLELNRRQLHSIPPGFQDSSKDDQGIGDLLIWNTILELGEKQNQNILFVTNDAKNDWWDKSENQALYSRFELVEEYRIRSQGKTIHLINFSEFLQLFGASPDVVNEVRQEEVLSSIQSIQTNNNFNEGLSFFLQAETAVELWIRAKYPDSIVDSKRREFPDFIVQVLEAEQPGFEVKRVGIEVKAYRYLKHINSHIHEIVFMALQAFQADILDELIIVFVLQDEYEKISVHSPKILNALEIAKGKVSILYGALSLDGRFVPKNFLE